MPPYPDGDEDFIFNVLNQAVPNGAVWITVVHRPSGVAISSSRFYGAQTPVKVLLRKHALEIANALKQENHDLQNMQSQSNTRG